MPITVLTTPTAILHPDQQKPAGYNLRLKGHDHVQAFMNVDPVTTHRELHLMVSEKMLPKLAEAFNRALNTWEGTKQGRPVDGPGAPQWLFELIDMLDAQIVQATVAPLKSS